MYSEKTPIIQHAETPKIKLNDGRKIPVIGFGTWKIPIEVAAGQVDQAIELGFSHIDTAQAYRNETEAGQAIRESGLSRDEIWVTTKWSGLDGKGPRQSAEESLEKLGLKYIDLLLIHHPRLANGDIPAAWAEFEKLQADGLVKSIGVSNFEIEDLKILLKDAKVKPVLNQILFHPYVYSSKAPLIEFLAENDIAFEAYSGLIPLTSRPGGPADKPVDAIANRLSIAPEQVLLAWVIAHSGIPITTSSKAERVKNYLQVPFIKLTKEDVASIDAAGKKGEEVGGAKWYASRFALGGLIGLSGVVAFRQVCGF
ncbi:Aldo/keto reductase [Mrakia frigida]|uniref:aldo/keto reductase n=1 Tax=Mrakia frigida TaxID=29902 RepID=UPI003FCBF411